jgi:cytidine deaminase
MAEFAHDSMQIYLANGGSVVQETTLGALLPRAFRLR